MVKLKITKIDNYLYDLIDERENLYTLNLEFLDNIENLKEGDYINISAELLNPNYAGYSSSYTFGKLDSQYGKSDLNPGSIDVIEVETGEKKYYLKRLYG